jgi:4-amino-4-deoxy-L-arabinose transferase-like glycosyltransferase
MNRNLLIAFAVLTVGAIIGIWFRPLMIIDETRYISVAWEMFDHNSFLVPLINSEPYHHKPPLLFWLIHLDWLIFGVNEISIRFIPLLFGLGSLLLTYKIYLTLWKEDIKGASYSALILSGTFIFLFYSSLVMFDVMLTFWVLLGVLGIIQAAKEQKRSAFVLIALSIGFGILTKGPVILVHLLPLILFARFWSENIDKRFYIGFFFAFLGGAAIALTWAIPAGIAGGQEYRDAIFWGQSANRMVKSFAHQRPLWWYLPILPLLFFPWSLLKSFWTGAVIKTEEPKIKMLLIWLISVVVIFSLISGKQVHYLLPEIPAFAILAARFLSRVSDEKKLKNRGAFIGHFYIVFALGLVAAYFAIHQKLFFTVTLSHVAISAVLLIAMGYLLLRYPFSSFENLLRAISISTLGAIFVVHFVMSNYLQMQNITPFAKRIAALQAKGIPVVQDKKYHDQFHFLGRLHDKILVIPQKERLIDYLKQHPEAVVITYKKRKRAFDETKIITKTAFKSRYAILVDAKNYPEF